VTRVGKRDAVTAAGDEKRLEPPVSRRAAPELGRAMMLDLESSREAARP